MRMLAFMKYGSRAASTRQRLRQYEPYLAEAGIAVDYLPLLDDDHIRGLAEGRAVSGTRTLGRYGKRLFSLLTRRDYDLMWVHCELFPYLPGLFERLAALPGKPIVFDYDDAIFHMYDDVRNPAARALLAGKLEPLLSRASLCCCGNPYLLEYAARFCPNSVLLPTVVDATLYRSRPAERSGDGPPVIGWIGSPSTWRYVRPLLPVLERLTREGKAQIRVVGAGAAASGDGFPGLEQRDWEEAREVADIQDMDIGIMPLPDEKWARGKCGYKLIQYMGCGLPVVASPVGVNGDIVEDGVHGFLATDPTEWSAALERLLGDAGLRAEMGARGRVRVEESYSTQAWGPRLAGWLCDVGSGRA